MVKNKNGGNRHKKMARKNQKPVSFNRKIRKPIDKDEMYAKVEQMYGGGHASIICDDGIERLLVIRKKFSGRNKRDNHISCGTYLLVGLRNWEIVSQGKKEKADLLEVYSSSNVDQLKREGVVFSFDEKENNKKEENFIEFSNEIDNSEFKFDLNLNDTNKVKSNTKIDNDEFDWDDI
jgi:initiation factor 1A